MFKVNFEQVNTSSVDVCQVPKYTPASPCSLRGKCSYLEFSWSVFSCIWTEYGEILRIFPCSFKIRKNKSQKNSEYKYYICSVCQLKFFLAYMEKKFSRFQRVHTAQKMNFYTKDFLSKFDQIRRKLGIWSHILKES